MKKMRKRFHTALIGATTFILMIAGPGSGLLYAQDEEVTEEPLEEVIVTGSRIARDAYTSAAPLQTFDAEEIKKLLKSPDIEFHEKQEFLYLFKDDNHLLCGGKIW